MVIYVLPSAIFPAAAFCRGIGKQSEGIEFQIRGEKRMKKSVYTLIAAFTSAIGFLSFQVVTADSMGYGSGNAGRMTYTSNGAYNSTDVWISKVQILPGSESGKYDIKVITKERNFTVEDKQGGMNKSGEGHIHFYLGVNPGKHMIYVELVNNDHTQLNPAVFAEKKVNIKSS
jgi:hypothetical protein